MRGWYVLVVVLMLTACASAPQSEPDRVATRVAEDLAVAATLTAVARQSQPVATAPPTNLPPPPTAAPTEAPAATAVPPTDTPAPLPTAVPTLSDPTVPGFGTTNGLTGEIILPGYVGPIDPVVFTDRIVFRLAVFDPDAGQFDGANIARVDVSIDDPLGNTVHVQPEQNSWYCSFGGGAPACNVWVFSQHNKQWPNGTPVCAGQGYQANMIVTTQNGNKTDASWRFNFAIVGDYPPCF